MSTAPVTLLVTRRAADGRHPELLAWLHEGERLATGFDGYLGSGVLAPPTDEADYQMIFRFADPETLHAWEHSEARQAWLARGDRLFDAPSEHRVRGLGGWFGSGPGKPPRWKQAVAIWLPFFPVSLLFNQVAGPLLEDLGLTLRIMLSTMFLTPVMVYGFIPLSTRLLAGWLTPKPHQLVR